MAGPELRATVVDTLEGRQLVLAATNVGHSSRRPSDCTAHQQQRGSSRGVYEQLASHLLLSGAVCRGSMCPRRLPGIGMESEPEAEAVAVAVRLHAHLNVDWYVLDVGERQFGLENKYRACALQKPPQMRQLSAGVCACAASGSGTGRGRWLTAS